MNGSSRWNPVAVCTMRPELEARRGDHSMPPFGVGSFVKVGASGERFWCHVVRCIGNRLEAKVANYLLHTPSIRYGDLLDLHERHVLESVSPLEGRAFREMVSELGEDEAALRWRQSRIDSGVAAPGSPSLRLVLPSGERRSSPRTRDSTSASSPPRTGS